MDSETNAEDRQIDILWIVLQSVAGMDILRHFWAPVKHSATKKNRFFFCNFSLKYRIMYIVVVVFDIERL